MVDSSEHTLYAPTEDEVQMWRDAAAPLIDQWKEEAGDDAQALYDGYVEALERHDARY
jgi:hypothetical protein